MATKYGRALVAAGKEHMSISHLSGLVTNPYPPPDPIPPPPPSGGGAPTGYHWLADFSSGTQDFSMFDTHDAQLGNTISDPTHGLTKGCTVVAKPDAGGAAWSNYMCRIVVSQSFPSSSSTGRITFLWEPGAYGNSWEQEGAETWYRMTVLFPNGSDIDYPGFITISPGDGVSSPWHVFQEWHKNDDASAPGPTSTKMEMAGSAMLFKPMGCTLGSCSTTWWYMTNQVQSEANGVGGGTGPIGGTPIPMQFNHWYETLVRFKWSPNPAVGEVEWWVDGVLRGLAHRATMSERSDSVTPGMSYQAGMYRDNAVGGTHGNETIYIGMMASGPTRASVGG
jgi:hypothetical protein